MTIRSGQSVTIEFTTSNPSTQVSVNADSLPVGTLVVNGVDNGATVTVANVTTGTYTAAVTLPTLAIGDVAQIRIAATVSTVAGKAMIWRDSKDVLLDSSGKITEQLVLRSGTAQAGTTSSVQLDSGASAVISFSVGTVVLLTGGTGAGQARTIVSYTGSTKQATIDRLWTTAPDVTTTFVILGADNPALNTALQVSATVSRVVVRSGTAQTGSTSNTIKLDASASTTDNLYNGDLITLTGGTGAGQTRTIVSYVGSTKVATVDRNWVTTPNNTSVFDIYASTTPSAFSDQGVAQAGAATTITLAASASSTNSVYVGSIVTILSGTGSGQTREITAYNGTTKVATVDSAWVSNPDTTSAYAVIPTVSGSGAPLASTDVNVITWLGSAPNVLISGRVDANAQATAAALTFNLTGNITGNLSGSVGSVTGDTPQTGDSYAIVNSVTFGNAAIKGYVDDIGVAGAGLTALGDVRLNNLDAAISSRMATYVQPTGFLAATFPVTVASTTNITAGTITNLLNAPTAGDLTAAMKNSVQVAADAAVSANTLINAIAGYIDTEIGDIKTVTDHLATTLELNAGNYRFTTLALANTPTSVGGTVDANLISVNGTTFTGPTVPSDRVMFSGTLGDQSTGSPSNVILPTGPAGLDVLIGSRLRITSGTGSSQERTISAWNVTPLAAGLDRPLAVATVSGDTFQVLYDNAPQLTADGGDVAASVFAFEPAALAQFFTTDSTKVYADAVTGSVVKETASGAAVGGGTVNANLVSVNGTTFPGAAVPLPANPPAGFLITASYGAAPGWYTAPTDVTTTVNAIKAKTDNLPADPAGLTALTAAHGSGSWQTATGFLLAVNYLAPDNASIATAVADLVTLLGRVPTTVASNIDMQTTLTALGALLTRITGVVPLAADYTSARAAKLDNLDVATGTRLAGVDYTAPNNTGIANLVDTLELNAGHYRFTTAALANAAAVIAGTLNANLVSINGTPFSGANIPADVQQWLASPPNALIAGRVDANTQATAASLNVDLIGSLSGSVGSVTGTTGGMTAAGWAGAFTINTTRVFTDSIAGSVVKEIILGAHAGTSTGVGTGIGSVLVDHNYGGIDNLTVEFPNGAAVDNATILAYLAADYAAGRRTNAFVVGTTLTNVLGHWVSPLMLDPGDYTLFAFKQGAAQSTTRNLTVS